LQVCWTYLRENEDEPVAVGNLPYDLAKQMSDVRRAMLAKLTNGADPAPHPTPPRAKPGPKPASREEVLAEAAAAETAIIELLKARPGLRHSEIVRALGAKATTTAMRLERLQKRGAVIRDEGGAWTASSP
jgi:hypothetical protein